MPSFRYGPRALFAFISRRNAIRSPITRAQRSCISNQFRRFGSLCGVERCSYSSSSSSFGLMTSRRVSFGAGSVFQRRHFLGCGDGEEGGGELSKIYQERRLLGIEICLCVFKPNNYELVFQKDDNLTDPFVLVRLTTARDTGLFDHLINLWQFKPGPIPGTCDLSILVDFKFNSPLYRQVASMFLKEVATRLMGAFSDRCRLVYGPGVRVDENAFEQRA
ncbi:hypothetical protein DY000_02054165 [Brassica cretica]|uniref:Coenzyme Q-binding protein COQ10 START domain-containing protein n=1 Tax=Brassica cretica TaxID=69181 RepID=A0ABQ7A596_BRACR|nr:hypothetical protein DY000_02054165 [Brassica cretica]